MPLRTSPIFPRQCSSVPSSLNPETTRIAGNQLKIILRCRKGQPVALAPSNGSPLPRGRTFDLDPRTRTPPAAQYATLTDRVPLVTTAPARNRWTKTGPTPEQEAKGSRFDVGFSQDGIGRITLPMKPRPQRCERSRQGSWTTAIFLQTTEGKKETHHLSRETAGCRISCAPRKVYGPLPGQNLETLKPSRSLQMQTSQMQGLALRGRHRWLPGSRHTRRKATTGTLNSRR